MAFTNIILYIMLIGLVIREVEVRKSYVWVDMYTQGDCRGTPRKQEILQTMCWYFPYMENDISGVYIRSGSCAVIMKGRCSGETYLIGYPTRNYCVLPCCGWNDRIKGVKDCTTRTQSIVCPQDTYVREVSYGEATEGITIHCYHPLGSVEIIKYNTHGKNIANPTRTNCPIAAFDLSASWDSTWRIYTKPSLSCQKKASDLNSTIGTHTSGNLKTDCSGEHKAVVGLTVEIDQRDVIKDFSTICRTVKNPADMCEPQEKMIPVVSCDNSRSGNEMECTYSRTVGVAKSTSLTKSEKREEQWSQELGFSLGVSIAGITASVTGSLGHSQLAGYEWSREDTSTFSEQTTVSASIKVRPYSFTVLEQLAAKCSFYGVKTTYFRTRDVLNKTTTHRYLTV